MNLLLFGCNNKSFTPVIFHNEQIKNSYYSYDKNLIKYLTFQNEIGDKIQFKDRFAYETAYFYYNRILDQKEGTELSYTLLAFNYSQGIYANVVEYIQNKKGFKKEITWEYSSYMCVVNATKQLIYNYDQKDCFIFSDEHKTIHWINFVAFNENSNSVCFVGFRCTNTIYLFSEWDEFFNEFFSFYDWNN